jgi:hypothetical protein
MHAYNDYNYFMSTIEAIRYNELGVIWNISLEWSIKGFIQNKIKRSLKDISPKQMCIRIALEYIQLSRDSKEKIVNIFLTVDSTLFFELFY